MSRRRRYTSPAPASTPEDEEIRALVRRVRFLSLLLRDTRRRLGFEAFAGTLATDPASAGPQGERDQCDGDQGRIVAGPVPEPDAAG